MMSMLCKVRWDEQEACLPGSIDDLKQKKEEYTTYSCYVTERIVGVEVVYFLYKSRGLHDASSS